MEYRIIRSGRRTVALEITRELCVLVRAPNRMPRAAIDKFVRDNEAWIAEHMAAQKKRAESYPEPTEEQKQVLIDEAKAYLPERVAYYSQIMGVTPTKITITGAKTRHGSCSPKNRICFSWRVMQYPREFADYVVVHELAHIKHKNHGREFYAFVASILPDYKEREKIPKGI